MKMTIAAAALIGLANVAVAQDVKDIPALDVAIDADTLQGQKINVTGCTIIGANLNFMMCGVKSKTGSVGSIHVDVKKLNRAQFKEALEKCAGLMPAKNCGASIVGELSKNGIGEPSLLAEQINWVK